MFVLYEALVKYNFLTVGEFFIDYSSLILFIYFWSDIQL